MRGGGRCRRVDGVKEFANCALRTRVSSHTQWVGGRGAG
jgi:hypothetical protein